MILSPGDKSKCCRRVKKCIKDACSMKSIKKRLPILKWLPKYKCAYFMQDVIAGITVGLMAIPQGIAFAIIAGLPPEHGLYASLTSGVVYVFFGSCYNVTVGPTAILAAMIAKYVANYSIDFAILAGFLTGVLILTIGVLQLGFLVEFISIPVISGFTTAAALQIAASQLKSLFGLSGSSGNYFAESIYNFVLNIKTIKLWEPVLGFGTIVMLMFLKKMGEDCTRTDNFIRRVRWFISLSRNAVVIIVGMLLTYILKITIDQEPLILVGDIGSGLPKFSWPPFTTTVENKTYTFSEMLQILGPGFIAVPFVAILESVAIAKAFADGRIIDATQEMIALGLCNIIGSFGQSMPITGSFARTAINQLSGVITPAGGVTKVFLIIFGLTSLTSTFYYIPKASLAGLIIFALFSMMDFKIIVKLWKNCKTEMYILLITMIVCLFSGLEYGIITGIIIQSALLLYTASKPSIAINLIDKEKLLIISLSKCITYCAAEHVRQVVLKASVQAHEEIVIIIEGTNLKRMDFTIASNLISIVKYFDNKSHRILLWNFDLKFKSLCKEVDVAIADKFVYASTISELSRSIHINV